MKIASARLRKGVILIQAFSKTTTDLWIFYGPVYVIARDSDPVEIGEKVIAALNQSTTGIAHPNQDEWKNVQQPMLDAAGVKSWSTLEKGCRSVSLEDVGVHISFMPSVGAENGAVDLPGHVILSAKNQFEIGKSLLEAFDACK